MSGIWAERPSLFRVLIETPLEAGIITDRTKPIHAAWVDGDELHRERDEVAGQHIADARIAELRELDRDRRPIGRAFERQA